MKPLIIIPARGGSKGIPGKNIKYLAGKLLIQYTIEAALGVFSAEQICISTDSLGIKNVAESLGLKVPFLRPNELSTDTVSSKDVINHALDFYQKKRIEINIIVLLQPTSPFRNSAHINKALLEYDESIDMVVSVQETASNPYYVLKEENNDGFLMPTKKADFTSRQDCPPVL